MWYLLSAGIVFGVLLANAATNPRLMASLLTFKEEGGIWLSVLLYLYAAAGVACAVFSAYE